MGEITMSCFGHKWWQLPFVCLFLCLDFHSKKKKPRGPHRREIHFSWELRASLCSIPAVMETFHWHCLYFCVYIFRVTQTSSLGHRENKIIVVSSQGRRRACWSLQCPSCSVPTCRLPLLMVGPQQLSSCWAFHSPLGGMGEWQMHLIKHIANAGERALTRVLKSGQKNTAVMSQLDFQRKWNICVYQLRNEHMRTHTHKAYLPPHTLSSRKGTYISLYT